MTDSTQPGSKPSPVRLGKNLDRYVGEKIDIQSVLADCIRAAHSHGWHIEEIPAPPKPSLFALTRPAKTRESRRIYISTGIHGDEPAGPLAARELLQANQWADDHSIWLLPCLNPTGFIHHTRENSEGTDLNRQYLQPKAEETVA